MRIRRAELEDLWVNQYKIACSENFTKKKENQHEKLNFLSNSPKLYFD